MMGGRESTALRRAREAHRGQQTLHCPLMRSGEGMAFDSVRLEANRTKEDDMTVKDPVCNMEIEEGDAVGSAEHEGKTFYFCSTDCKEEFEADPSAYAI